MPSPNPDPSATARDSSDAGSDGQASTASNPAARGAAEPERAAQGAIPEPVPVTRNPLPAPPTDSPAEAEGRRTLSTAFVRAGPDGRLVVELRDGRVLVLRNVVMRRKDYCGEQVVGGKRAGAQYCGGYAEVAAARPGAEPSPEELRPAVSIPVESPRGDAKRN